MSGINIKYNSNIKKFFLVRYSIGYAFRAGNKDAMLQLHSSENSDAQPCKSY